VPGPTVDELVSRLRAEGVRMTGPRRVIVAALAEAGSHVTAEELHRRVTAHHPEVSVSSVYRTMDLLAEHGVVDHVHMGHGPAEYHLADEEHAHLVCNGCRRTVELDRSRSSAFAAEVAEELGFHLDLGHFALTGWCEACWSRRS
jgi:Fur family transcriptional regulator, ferric uptake regulator